MGHGLDDKQLIESQSISWRTRCLAGEKSKQIMDDLMFEKRESLSKVNRMPTKY